MGYDSIRGALSIYGVGLVWASSFSMLSSLFSIASSLSRTCFSVFPMSSDGLIGRGVGEGHRGSPGGLRGLGVRGG